MEVRVFGLRVEISPVDPVRVNSVLQFPITVKEDKGKESRELQKIPRK